MKKLKTLITAALCLCAVCILGAAPAYALEYNISAPGDPEYGNPTSFEPVVTADGGAMKNEDLSKSAALIPPGFGTPSSYMLNTGEYLTPNLVASQMAGEGTVNGSAESVTPPSSGIVSDTSPSTAVGFTGVTGSMYYSNGSLGTIKIPSIGLTVGVYEGTGDAPLLKGAGHFEGTSIWDGNVAVAGHNRGVRNDFGKIHTLRYGDIITGDLGGVWAGEQADRHRLDWLEDKPFTTLFVDGNHENFDLLNAYPEQQWRGGRVHAVRPHVLHLMRGQVFEIGGLTWFTMGGAASHDIDDGILDPAEPDFERKYWRMRRMGAYFRVLGRSWWPEEMPNDEEYAEAEANLERVGWSVNCVLTHCAPTSVTKTIGPSYQPDKLTDFLESVRERCQFSRWFCGHYHLNRVIDERFVIQWKQISKIEKGSGGLIITPPDGSVSGADR